jgi:hypothetical protein
VIGEASLRVFIANFGQGNYLWPKCLERSTVATINNEKIHPYWEARDRSGFIEFAVANLKTARMETPTTAVASRWYGLNDAIAETSGDLWVHREKENIWWTISKPDPVEIALMPSSTPLRNGPRIFELHKPAEAWSNSDRKGRRLSWTALHPKARDFLFTEGTLQKLAPDNAEFAISLVEGLSLDAWHSRTDWRAKQERTRKSPTTIYDARKITIFRMVDTVFSTVAGANGQQVLRTLKDKRTTFDKPALEKFVSGLIDDQDGLCAITGITLQFDDEGTDPELRCSLDRIDSSGHYEPGNLQVVCRFVNRWKSDGEDAEFRRLIELVRSNNF